MRPQRPLYIPDSGDYLTVCERHALRHRKAKRRAMLRTLALHAMRVLLFTLIAAALACLLYTFAFAICDLSPSASCTALY
jgi:hypothetical protein